MSKRLSIRICPKCAHAFYSISSGAQDRCKHCDFVYLERRDRGRIHSKFDFILTLKSKNIKASLQDYSTGGLRAVYHGKTLPANAEVDINLKALNLQGTVRAVWSKRLSPSLSESGFKLTNAVGTGRHGQRG